MSPVVLLQHLSRLSLGVLLVWECLRVDEQLKAEYASAPVALLQHLSPLSSFCLSLMSAGVLLRVVSGRRDRMILLHNTSLTLFASRSLFGFYACVACEWAKGVNAPVAQHLSPTFGPCVLCLGTTLTAHTCGWTLAT